jgi:hypothetical protein
VVHFSAQIRQILHATLTIEDTRSQYETIYHAAAEAWRMSQKDSFRYAPTGTNVDAVQEPHTD